LLADVNAVAAKLVKKQVDDDVLVSVRVSVRVVKKLVDGNVLVNVKVRVDGDDDRVNRWGGDTKRKTTND